MPKSSRGERGSDRRRTSATSSRVNSASDRRRASASSSRSNSSTDHATNHATSSRTNPATNHAANPASDRRRTSATRANSQGGLTFFSANSGSGRFFGVLIIFAVIAVVFFARLIYLQVVVSDEYSAMAEESRTISFDTTPHRGTIYDRNGVVLAVSVDATTIYCNPSEVTNATNEARQIASILGGQASDYTDPLTRDDTSFAYIKRQADVSEADALKECDLDGIYFISDTRREYPNGSIGGQVVGYCNVDGEGITGLELQYNDILSGTPGTYSAERGQDGTPIPGGVHEDTPAIDGQDIMVSLDINFQMSVETALEEGAIDLSAAGGSSVVMDAETGEIYAVCSLPYMDPSDMSASATGSENLTAITQAFEPGSDFKTVSALAVVESGTMNSEDTIYCPEALYADEYVVTDSHSRAAQTMSLRDIIAQSSNIGISLSVSQMGFREFHDAILRYNFASPTGVDFPGEEPGYLPDYDTWSLVASYNICFGQGISATPLQITRFYASLINDGVEVTPHFLISLPQTGEYPEYETSRITDNTDAIDQVRSMLRSVVEEGTGTDADIEGYDVAGKTSTAEVAKNGTYIESLYNLCFVGFIDNSSSPLVCFVCANEVNNQAKVTSIFKDIMTTAIGLYNIVPE